MDTSGELSPVMYHLPSTFKSGTLERTPVSGRE